ncbi:EAL domain-containing protein [Butyrivibrio sp. JL13D10]|uniref:EAL domain-containing protein n=1 Tax=Butyrivibrio sp. JL13D10 TaxID=3236815 RepID=UPI0038B50131
MDELYNYVVNKIDEAIEKGWIEVFFQPVVRALTEELCGLEALARWNDPYWGMLAPFKFVKPLEDKDLIYKLDCYVVKAVCRILDNNLKKSQPVIPVSINFSRLDFLKCDMFEIVETEVAKYDIPRDYIHIEITESIFVADEGFLSDVIRKFRAKGYEIWMDDFGSGYSSLNLLKDYDFDMLKMDMNFLTSFTEKSKAIMRSTITMAKDIGIKTLAEGVETAEQLEFLKSIGCERIQGYYYGRPERMDDLLAQVREKGIAIEKRQWRHFYDVAGLHVRDVDIPLEIIEDDGKDFHTLFMNRAYMEQILHTYECDYAEIDRRIYHTGSPLIEKYREFANVIENSSNIETFYYTDNGNYLRFRAKCLASHEGHHIIKGSIINISMDQNINEREMLDGKLRELNLLFDVVDLINIGNNVIAPLLGRFKYITNESYVYSDLRNAVKVLAKESIYPSEVPDFIEYMNFDTLRTRIEKCKKGYVEKVFRIKQPGGAYKRKNIIVMMVPGTGGNEYLVCYKSIPEEISRVLDGLTASARSLVDKYLADSGAITYSEIWENMIWGSAIKFFWKDKDRRFLGASQSFLDFYGFKSLDDILGKNDEDMGWHVSEDPYKNDEIRVLTKGERIIDASGQCIVEGVVHDIRCQKMPIYRNGEIVGLVGFFEDKDEELYRLENFAIPSNIDPITRLMNARAIMICLLDYAEQYVDKNRSYGVILIRNEKYSRILETYGKDVAEKFLQTMSKHITSVTSQTCAVGRLKESYFVILTFIKTREALEYFANNIKESVEKITESEGNSITVRIKTAFALRTDEGISDENIFQTVLEEVEKE